MFRGYSKTALAVFRKSEIKGAEQMSNYNYGRECKKFHEKWKNLRREYEAAGMSESVIQAMYDYDWEEMKRERIICIHTQSIESLFLNGDTSSEDQSPLLNQQIKNLSVEQPEISEWDGRLDWIEDIDTPELVRQLKVLSPADLELLSCFVVDGLSRAEIARKLNISRSAITQRVNRIKNILEKLFAAP